MHTPKLFPGFKAELDELVMYAVHLCVNSVDSCVELVDAMIEPPTAPKHRRYDCCEGGEERHHETIVSIDTVIILLFSQ